MSDIYVFGPNDSDNDYSSFGLVGAILPTEATFDEAGNGDSSVSITCPIDEFGRYASLVKGNILLCPVPVRTTPEIQNGSCVTTVWTYKVKPLDQLTSKKQRTLYKKQKGNSRLKIMNAGDIVTVVLKPTSSSGSEERWKAKSKYGTGWIIPDGFELITEKKIDNNANAIQEVQSPWSVQPQRFRIYEVEKTIDEVTVQARHISYDLLYNLTTYKSDESVTLQTALDGVLNNCVNSDHGFTAYTNVANEQAGLAYDGKNPIDAMLDPEEGLCAKYKVNLIRDNDELFFLNDPGMNRGVKIAYGKNMTGVTYTQSDDQVSTRIMPVGENKDGTPLYLSDNPSERFVDSNNINNYPVIHVYRLDCDNCKVGQKDSNGSKVTVAVARARMRKQAEDLLKTGVDNPTIKMEVEFVNLGDTEEYNQFKNLENCFLYDYLIIQHGKQDINVTAQIQEIEWDILTDTMKKVTIGTVGETLANMGITTWQIPVGFSGSKIANGTLGGGALREDAIATRHLQADSVNASVIAAHSITADRLDATTVNAMTIEAVRAKINELVAGQITTDQLYADLAAIAVAQITTANISNANIDWATIANLTAAIANIANAQIGSASIGTAQIKDAKIDWAKIYDLTADTAIISEGVGGKLYIARLAVTEANMTSLTVGELMVKAEDGSFKRLTVDADGNVTAETVQVEGGNVADNTISGGKLIENTITARELNVESIFADTALIRAIKAANIDVSDLFAAEATISALNSWLIKADTIQSLQGQLNLWASDKISAAVSGMRIGGTNMVTLGNQNIVNAGGSTAVYLGKDWYRESEHQTTISPYSGVCWLQCPGIEIVAGRKYTLSYYTWIQPGATAGAVKFRPNLWGGTSDTDKYLNDFIPFVVSTPTRYTVTFDTTGWATGTYTLRFVMMTGQTHEVYFTDIKLEEGEKATAWSPNPNELRIGTNILLDLHHTLLKTPYFEVDVSGENGDFHADENGLSAKVGTFETLNCPGVVKYYTGAASITLGAGSDVSAISNALCNRMMTYDVTITLAGDVSGALILKGLCGSGNVTIKGAGHALNGYALLSNNGCRINVESLKISKTTANRQCVNADRCVEVKFYRCIFNANNAPSNAQGISTSYSSVFLQDCEFYNITDCAMSFSYGTDALVITCKGAAKYCFWYDGATLRVAGSRPSGLCAGGNPSFLLPADPSTITVNTGSATPTETPVTTESYTASVTGTYYPSGHWINDNTIRQGHEGTGSNARKDYGCMWFNASALTGKTIKSATLTIKRISGKGRSSSVTLKLWTTTLTGKSGKPTDSLVNLGEIGKIANGETATFNVPTSAINVIASGGGLVLYTEETTNKTGKTYSENYAHFEGVGGSAPVLTVTYQ